MKRGQRLSGEVTLESTKIIANAIHWQAKLSRGVYRHFLDKISSVTSMELACLNEIYPVVFGRAWLFVSFFGVRIKHGGSVAHNFYGHP